MLIDNLREEKFLRTAWEKINKSNEKSYGISEVTIRDFKVNIDSQLNSIQERLKDKYIFSPLRAVVIPKKEKNKVRPLRIPDIGDRIVLKGITILIEDQLKEFFKPTEGISFAFQKKLGVEDAIKKIMEYYVEGYQYVLETDICNFFEEVDRTKLIESLFNALPESSLRELVEQSLRVEVQGQERLKNEDQRKLFINTGKGIPQGSSLSPLLANFYLQPFDIKMKEQGFKLIRYADDFVVMCKSEEEARAAFSVAKQFLNEKLVLSLYPFNGEGKTSKILKIGSEDFSFLSVAFDGKNIFPNKKSVEKLNEKINEACFANDTVWSILNTLRFLLDGWISAYSYTDVERHFTTIDTYINRQLLLGLGKLHWRFQKKDREKMPKAYRRRKESHEMLSMKHRKNSGVPLCKEILSQRRRPETPKVTLENIIASTTRRHKRKEAKIFAQ